MRVTGISPLDEGRILAIQGLVAHLFGLQLAELSISRRERAFSRPRQIAMYLAKLETDASLADIGSLFGGKHHSTVIHATERIEALRQADSATDLAIDMIRRNLKSVSSS